MRKLNELVEIRSGYTFRSALDTYESGDVEVIQAKDLGSDFGFASRPHIAFPGESKHFLQTGEILVSARGYAKAQLFQDTDAKAVASSSIFVLTPRTHAVSAEFITMFFNSLRGIKAVLELSSGASVKSITKESLGQIIIPEIPPDKEQALGRAVQAIDDELSLMSEKQLYLNHIRESIISKTLKEATQ